MTNLFCCLFFNLSDSIPFIVNFRYFRESFPKKQVKMCIFLKVMKNVKFIVLMSEEPVGEWMRKKRANCIMFVSALALLFLFEYALWRLAGFNLVTLYNYAKFSSFRIQGKQVQVRRPSVSVNQPSPQPILPSAQIMPPSFTTEQPMILTPSSDGSTTSVQTSAAVEIDNQTCDVACMQDVETSQSASSSSDESEIYSKTTISCGSSK